MKRVTEEGWALKRISAVDGKAELCRPFYRTRSEARAAFDRVPHTCYWLVKIRVTEITPVLQKKIKICLAAGKATREAKRRRYLYGFKA